MGLDDSYSKVLMHFDGTDTSTTFTDESGKIWTAHGNAQLATSQVKFGTASGVFPATGSDYVSTPTSSDFDFGTGDFTIDFWLRIPSDQNTRGLISACSDGTFTGWCINIEPSVNNTIQFASNASGSFTSDILSSSTVTSGTWNHIAVVRLGTTATMYLNGVSVGSHSVSGYTYNSSGNGLVLGRIYTNTDNYYLNGWIDELRVTKGIARWSGNFDVMLFPYSPPVTSGIDDSNTVSLLHFDGLDTSTTITDETSKTWTVHGNAQINSQSRKFGETSLYLDGSGDYITAPDSTDWEFGTGDFTVDFWVKYNALPAEAAYVSFFSQSNGAGAQQCIGYLYKTGGIFVYQIYNAPTLILNVNAPTITTGVWYHMAFVRNGNSWMVFQDGVQVGSTATYSGAWNNPSSNFFVGMDFDGTQGPLNGWLDEYRVSKGIARWTSNFTPPNAPYSGTYVPPSTNWIPRVIFIG